MLISIPGNDETEEIKLPNGQFVRIMYIKEKDPNSMPDNKYSSRYRLVQLFDKDFILNPEREGAKLLGEHVEKNPCYDPDMVLKIFEHLDDGPIHFE